MRNGSSQSHNGQQIPQLDGSRVTCTSTRSHGRDTPEEQRLGYLKCHAALTANTDPALLDRGLLKDTSIGPSTPT
jgi:hypothetical protein